MSLYNVDAEASVVGAVMIDNSLVKTLSSIVRCEDLYFDAYRVVWGAITSLDAKGSGIDLVTVSEFLEVSEQIDAAGGMASIAEMVRGTPSTSNATVYAEAVRELADRRRVVRLAQDIAEGASDRQRDLSAFLSESKVALGSAVRVNEEEVKRIGEYLAEEFLDPLDRRYNGEEEAMGLSYGIKDLDDATHGLKGNELCIIAGRPAMGKSAKMMNILRANISEDKPIQIESLEMTRPALMSRLMASIADIPLDAIRDPKKHSDIIEECFTKLAYPISILNKAPIYINQNPRMTISSIRANTQRIFEKHGKVSMVMIDYLGKVKVDGDYGQRHDRAIEEVAAGAKEIAKDYDCPVVLLAQLNRGVEQRPNKRPNLSDLKDSSAIEQEADTVIFLYRDEYYNEDNPDNKGLAEAIIAKQREGATKTVHMVSRLANGRFEDLAPSSYMDSFS